MKVSTILSLIPLALAALAAPPVKEERYDPRPACLPRPNADPILLNQRPPDQYRNSGT